MREILFRGKLANGKWAYGNLDIGYNGVCIITPDDTPIGSYGQVDPETVGQYTGLTDKNSKKTVSGSSKGMLLISMALESARSHSLTQGLPLTMAGAAYVFLIRKIGKSSAISTTIPNCSHRRRKPHDPSAT